MKGNPRRCKREPRENHARSRSIPLARLPCARSGQSKAEPGPRNAPPSKTPPLAPLAPPGSALLVLRATFRPPFRAAPRPLPRPCLRAARSHLRPARASHPGCACPPCPHRPWPPEPGRWLWTCRAGFEPHLYEELAWAGAEPRLLGEALVESEGRQGLAPAFARQGFRVLASMPGAGRWSRSPTPWPGRGGGLASFRTPGATGLHAGHAPGQCARRHRPRPWRGACGPRLPAERLLEDAERAREAGSRAGLPVRGTGRHGGGRGACPRGAVAGAGRPAADAARGRVPVPGGDEAGGGALRPALRAGPRGRVRGSRGGAGRLDAAAGGPGRPGHRRGSGTADAGAGLALARAARAGERLRLRARGARGLALLRHGLAPAGGGSAAGQVGPARLGLAPGGQHQAAHEGQEPHPPARAPHSHRGRRLEGAHHAPALP